MLFLDPLISGLPNECTFSRNHLLFKTNTALKPLSLNEASAVFGDQRGNQKKFSTAKFDHSDDLRRLQDY